MFVLCTYQNNYVLISFNFFLILELETEIEQLRETQKKYGNILKLAKSMASQFQCFIQTQVKTSLT